MTKTELQIEDFHKQFYKSSQEVIDQQVKQELMVLKSKHNYSKIHMISGNGTWIFKTYTNHKECTKDNNKQDYFKPLDEFLMLMAGTYNIYPSDCIV